MLSRRGLLKRDSVFELLARAIPERLLPHRAVRALPPRERYRVFAAVKNVNWEAGALVDSWRSLEQCEVVHFDWGERFDQYAPDWHTSGKRAFNEELWDRVRGAHRAGGIDIFFSYLSGRWVFPETIARISSLGIFTVNLSFDDARTFWGEREGSGYSGNAAICRAFDLNLTLQREADVRKYRLAGGAALFIPAAGNPASLAAGEPRAVRTVPVSFVGQRYGEREESIRFLREAGVPVQVRGVGWPEGGVPQGEMLEIYRNSLVTLGFGYVGGGRDVVGLKGRDFEVPLTGTAYLTSYNRELARYFEEDREILFYRDRAELLRKVRHCLEHPEETVALGLAGRRRALAEHTWQQRWRQLLDFCTGSATLPPGAPATVGGAR